MEEAIRILVVDDEPDIRRICRILLETGGYTVLEAATGAEAVEQVRQHPELDLILMDIMMPELGGYDACSRIRSYSTAPVLFLTAKTQEGDKRRAYDSGGDDFLAKPFSHAELMMKVESLLRRYRVYKSKSSGRTLRPGIVLDEENRRVLVNGQPLELTETEFSILHCLAENRQSSASFDAVSSAVLQSIDLTDMQEADAQMVRRLYGFAPSEMDGCLLYYPATNMGARELLLVKLSDLSQQTSVSDAIQARRQTQMKSFEGYGVEQYDLLSNSVVEIQGNYILFVVHENAAAAAQAFLKAL